MYENINNLTTLWKQIGLLNGKYAHKDGLNLSICSQSEWPNRLWFDTFPDEEILNKSIDLIAHTHSKIKISTFLPLNNLHTEDFKKLILEKGFALKSMQYGMFRKVENFQNEENPIKFHKVTSENEALIWAKIFHFSFNYQITTSQILLSFEGYDCFLVLQNSEIIGCCMCFSINPEIIGLHAFAIQPTFQRKGLGTATMKAFLNIYAKENYKYIVLQSSENGHSLYQQLGFNEQFLMFNYELKNK